MGILGLLVISVFANALSSDENVVAPAIAELSPLAEAELLAKIKAREAAADDEDDDDDDDDEDDVDIDLISEDLINDMDLQEPSSEDLERMDPSEMEDIPDEGLLEVLDRKKKAKGKGSKKKGSKKGKGLK